MSQTRPTTLRILGMVWVVLGLGGCAARPVEVVESAPVAGLKPATARETYTVDQLIQINVAMARLSEWYLARLATACDQLARGNPSSEARHEALHLKAMQGASAYAIVTGPNPIVGLFDLCVLVNLTHVKWVGEGKAVAVFGERANLLIDVLEDAKRTVRAGAARVVPEQEVAALEESIRHWRTANPGIQDVEFIRFQDYVTELARSLAPQEQEDLRSNLRAAASGLSDARLLAERMLYLTSRMPRVVQWQVEAQVSDIAARGETRQLLADISQLSRTVGELKQQASGAQTTLEAFPQKLAESVSEQPLAREAIATAKEAIVTAKEAIGRSELAITQLGTVESSLRGLDGAITGLAQQVQRINQTYEPATVQKMVQEGRTVAVREARNLIFLIAGCLAALLGLHALLRRVSQNRSSR